MITNIDIFSPVHMRAVNRDQSDFLILP